MPKLKRILKSLTPYALAALAVGALYTVIYASNGLVPFGDKSPFMIDLDGQYIDFFSYLSTMAQEHNSIFYSFSKTLGGDTVSLFAYYLMSPFNFVFYLFPKEDFGQAFYLLLMLKLCACSVTALYFFRNFEGAKAYSWGFAVAYAFISYNMTFYYNIMWLDGVVLLPLIALGIMRIVRGKRPYLYIFSLAAALIINFYIGYMLCIFSVLFFLYLLFSKQTADMGGKTRSFFLSSLASGALCAFWLIPLVFSLEGGKFGLRAASMKSLFDCYQLLAKFFTGAHNYNQSFIGIPAVFCGIFTVFAVLLYFFNKRISGRKRAMSALLCVCFVISFTLADVDLFWHALNKPHCFNCRYSFIFSFLLLYLAVYCLRRIKGGVTLKALCIACGITLAAAQIVSVSRLNYITVGWLYLDFACVAAYGIFLLCTQRKDWARYVVPTVTAAALTVNMGVNAAMTFDDFPYKDYSDYTTAVSETQAAVDAVKAYDAGFYRMEKTYYRNQNDPMQAAYNGTSHFSSTEKTFVKEFMGRIGFRNHGYWAFYGTGSTEGADCLLGIKYLMGKEKPLRSYGFVTSAGDVDIYENTHALKLGFVSAEPFETALTSDNPFQNLNDIFRSLSGETKNIYTAAPDYTVKTVGLQTAKSGKKTVYTDSDIKSEVKSAVTLQIPVTSTDPLYLYITAPGRQNVRLSVNGTERGEYLGTYNWSIVTLGSFNIGDTVNVKLQTSLEKTEIYDYLLYYEDSSRLYDICDELNAQGCTLEKQSSRRLKGTFDSPDGGFLTFSIPYDAGWRLYVDGKRTELKAAFGTFMTAEVTAGEHTVKLVYTPRGFSAGAAVSAVSCALLTAYAVYSEKLRKKKAKETLNKAALA